MTLNAATERALYQFQLIGQCLQCLADLTSPSLVRLGPDTHSAVLDTVRREDLTSLLQVLSNAHTSAQTSLEAALAAGSDK